MPNETTNYQCPACTGPLHYDGSIGKLKCDYCESTYEVAEIEKLYKEKEEAAAKAAEEEKKKQTSTSPVYRKYLDVQDRYPQAIIAMRLGDFYEVFGKNAEVLANELPLTLTGRDCGLESRVPMVGFPYHTAEMYFGKILSNGHTLVVMENDDEVRELPSAQGVDLETGEILSEEEMREFDGDIEEPKDLDDDIDTSAFDKDALCKLDEMFGDKLTLR